MLTTYVVQALLVSLYLSILLARKRNRQSSYVEKITTSIKHSTTTFLNASFVFCIAMLCATLFSFIRALVVRTQPMPTSAYTASTMVSMYSILPPALLNMASSNMLRRSKGRKSLWSVVTILLGVVLALEIVVNWFKTLLRYDQKFLSSRRYNDDQLDWENTCAEFGPMRNIRNFATGLGALIFFALAVYIASPIVPVPKKLRKKSWYKRIIAALPWLALISGFITMWFCIGWLIQFRRTLDVFGGESNKDLEWSFGQVLALATWVPVLVEICYLYGMTPERALTGRLIRPFEVAFT